VRERADHAVSGVDDEIAVGVDIGGTSVKLGALRTTGASDAVLGERSVPVAGVARAGDVLDAIAAAVTALADGAPRDGIGVGMPGLLDRDAGAVLESPNLPIFDGCNLRRELSARLGIPPELVLLENDANVAALGEARLGAARGVRNALIVTLGTGVGGGLILEAELVVGDGMAGEIGHVTIEPDGEPCGCGSRGCLEMYASATAARRRARAAGLTEDLALLAERARAADGPERALLDAVGRDLGHGLAAAVCLVDVRTFVFGGGFAAALDRLEAGIRRGVAEWAFGARATAVSLKRAELGSAAGWIGAAHLPRIRAGARPRPAVPS
jgi:glucokinase